MNALSGFDTLARAPVPALWLALAMLAAMRRASSRVMRCVRLLHRPRRQRAGARLRLFRGEADARRGQASRSPH
jgi:hypothetical protein